MLLTISAPSREKESPQAEAGKHAARAPRPPCATSSRATTPAPAPRRNVTSWAPPRPALLSRREQNHLRAQLLIEKPAFLTQGCRHLQASWGFPPGGAHLARIRKSNNGGGVSFLCTYLSSGCRIHFQNCFQWASSQLAVAALTIPSYLRNALCTQSLPEVRSGGRKNFGRHQR